MKYRLLYLCWLLPAYLLFLIVQQGIVHTQTIKIYEDGVSIAADVIEFDIKQIAAQSNGYVIITFTDPDGVLQTRKLSLSVQMAQRIIDTSVIPIRYLKDSYQEIVMIPTYELQKSTSLSNMGVAGLGFIILSVLSFYATRYANKQITSGPEVIEIERIDA